MKTANSRGARLTYAQTVGYTLLLLIILAIFSPGAWAASACKVNYSIPNQWNNGFTANVSVTNTGDAWKGWTVTWDMPNGQQITGLWNGVSSQSGAAVTVKDAGWNANVGSNASVQFGFNGSHTGTNAIPSNVKVNGVLCAGNPAPPPPPAAPVVACEVLYSLPSVWGNGFTADVMVKNKGDALNGWTVTWDMPNDQTITGLWNGQFQQSAAHVEVQPVDWNRSIVAGGVIQFGFNGAHTGLNQIPGNVALNGVKCSGQVDPPPPPPPSCNVQYRIQNQWDNGFTGTVDIKNTGSPWNGWKVTWTMPSGQQVTNGWNGQFSQQGTSVSVGNVDFNKIIGQNSSISMGFNASHTGLNLIPIDVAVNGTRCNGQADTLAYPPQAPTDLRVIMQDNTNAALSWQVNSGVDDQLVLERREASAQWGVLATLTANTRAYQDTTLVIGKIYEYRVKAVNSAGSSAYTDSVSAKRQDRTDIRAAMLANNCAACHGTDGNSSDAGIPSISGMDRTYFVRTMQAYRNGSRASSVMSRIAKGYTDTQLERLADYFAAIEFRAAPQTTDPVLVSRGKAIHATHCMFCHSATDTAIDQTRTRLNQQTATYLHATLEDYVAGRSSNVPTEMAHQLRDLKLNYGDDALQALAHYYAADTQAKAGGNTDSGGDTGDGTGSDGGAGDNDGGGNTGDGTGEQDGNPASLPLAPANLTASVLDNAKVQLSWKDASSNETAFRIERRLADASDADWVVLTETAANVQAYTDLSASMGNSYAYRVAASNTAGVSASTTPVTATLLSLVQYGQSQYQRQSCASCHGADGKGGFTNKPLTHFTAAQLDSLTHTTALTMPPSNPGVCVGNCALGISHYIIEVLAANHNGGDTGTNPQACSSSPPPGKRSLRLLTRQEYQNTVNDLLGLSVSIIHELPDENRVEGFDNNVASNLVTGTRMEAYLSQAEKLAAQAVQHSWSNLVPCSGETAACAQQFIQQFGKRAYRRPLSSAEVSAHAQRFSQGTFRDAVENTVMAMLASPHFLYRSELGELQADGTYRLTPYEVASSLSYLFLGSMPDAALFQAADNNALQTPEQRIAQASRLLSSPRSRQQVGNFVGQWLLSSSPYALPNKDLTVYPGYTDAVRAAMSQELIGFFNHVAFDSTQQFDELFTANYVLANKALADFYHLSGPTGSALQVTPVMDGTRTGLLTLGAVLSRYANSAESHPFKRGAFFFERVLCHDLAPPENAGVIEPPTPDPTATTRERFDFHSKSMTACYSCHQYLDGPGFSFEKYDGVGQFRPLENGKPIEVSGILRGMETYTPDEEISFNDLMHLSQLVADSDTAAQCVARQYYRYTTGRVETVADNCALESYLQTYAASGYNLQTMLLGIVNAPGFTVRRAD
ncbi:Cytochrome c553 [Thiothrix caldifontis]|uniref:Cytochrome c553 n=1 Tax=Thiothrix caldifontis TaxID=525918 RepID=A0A1H4B516_9GAMM|nr:cellulose binding domain-containing protein [Thiothrix caldifontis]SEA43325.1 Cytochrome c553 [Thiothrix caldifontis]